MRTFFGSPFALAIALLAGLAPRPLHGTADVPSQVRAIILDADRGAVDFYLPHSAYTALFALSPGGGVAVLYPRQLGWGSDDGYTRAGHHRAYDPGPSPMWGSSSRTYRSERTYFLLASSEPLRLHALGPGDSGIRRHLGELYWAEYTDATINRLVDVLLSSNYRTEWTSDIYRIPWGGSISSRLYSYSHPYPYRYGHYPHRRYARISCNGVILEIPEERLYDLRLRLCGDYRDPYRDRWIRDRDRYTPPRATPRDEPTRAEPRRAVPRSEPTPRTSEPRQATPATRTPEPRQATPTARPGPRDDTPTRATPVPSRKEPTIAEPRRATPAPRATTPTRPSSEPRQATPRTRRDEGSSSSSSSGSARPAPERTREASPTRPASSTPRSRRGGD